MAYLHYLARELVILVSANRYWMTWNLLLAIFPAVLAVALFTRHHRRTLAWWAGVGVFALFLPNAPYVVTDLIHLRSLAAGTPSDGVVVAGVLPLFAVFITVGFLAYLVCTELVLREVRVTRPAARRLPVEVALHLLSAVGIILGRISRLNSWDTLTEPAGTAERIFTTLTWRGAPVALMAVFAAVGLTHIVVRTLVFSGGRVIGDAAARRRVVSSPA